MNRNKEKEPYKELKIQFRPKALSSTVRERNNPPIAAW